jgi:hypothetical protein
LVNFEGLLYYHQKSGRASLRPGPGFKLLFNGSSLPPKREVLFEQGEEAFLACLFSVSRLRFPPNYATSLLALAFLSAQEKGA